MKKDINHLKTQIIDILKQAMNRETAAFNYYIKSAGKTDFREAKILFNQLAEEERNHRRLIKREIEKIEQLVEIEPDGDSYSSKRVGYDIDGDIPFKSLPAIKGLDIAAVSLPLEFISGDLLEVKSVAGGRGLSILLCDVMGHGVSPSLVKSEIRQTTGYYFDEIYNDEDLYDTKSLISLLNEKAVGLCEDKCRFITAVHAILSMPDMKLTYTSAGHDTPIIIRNNMQYIDLNKTDLVLGAERDVTYSLSTVNLFPGDVIVVYSDGITEITKQGEGVMYQRESLIKLVRSVYPGSAKEIAEQIFKVLRKYSGNNKFYDDMSLIVIKINE